METLLFRNDKRLRDKLYAPEGYQHPAKANLYMMQTIIEKYTTPGDTILDPMGGVGSTMIAALMGRNVVLVELEPHYIAPMKASWEKMRQHPMLGYSLGEVLIIRGDARHLPIASADHIISSPPYEASVSDNKEGPGQTSVPGGWKAGTVDKHGGYTRPQAIITSPPYEEHHQGGIDPHPEEMSPQGREAGHTGERYTRPVDAVVSSPPYEGQMTDPHDRKRSIDQSKWGDGRRIAPPHSQVHLDHNYGGDLNIGNQRGTAYWESMRLVYQECFRGLRPGGVMALVLKGVTRDGQYVDLPAETATLCEALGFSKFDEWRRELWTLSFWRILQGTDKEETVVARRQGLFDLDIQEVKAMKRINNGKLDERLRYETVLAFRKSGDAVVML